LNDRAVRAAREEDAMETARHAWDPVDDAARFARLLAGARGSAEVVAAVREYLAAWPPARVANLQRVDGGWAPFDAGQRPIPLHRPTDLHRIRDAMRVQCASLLGAGVAPAAELVELDEFLSLACAKLVEIEPGLAPQYPNLPERQAESRALR
jgi:hypothetical protein